VTFGLNVPQSGPYSAEGEDELRGYRLAIDHLNNGGGWVDTDRFRSLTGDGVLGKEVEFVTGDTETNPDPAEESARRMIEEDDVIMFTGGSSSSVAIRQQEVALEKKVLYMCCLTHSNDTTGEACQRYSFREMFNGYMSAQALQPVLEEEFGSDIRFYQLWADYTWGETVQDSMADFMVESGWQQIGNQPTPLGTDDYRSYLEDVADSVADVVFLVHYGLDGANSLSQAREILPEDMEIVVPLYNRLMARSAASSIEDVYGTIAWDQSIEAPLSQTFQESFQQKFGDPEERPNYRIPSGPAHLAYTQTLQYAAAVERAGTFSPPEVIRELEGHVYAAGMGREEMRACDHQAIRPIPVVKGLAESEQETGRYFEFVSFTRDVGYDCNQGPAGECELGPYGDETEE